MKEGLASQRIVELLLDLLLTDRGRTKAELRSLPGYSNLDDAAFETAFQRDKDTLAEAGVSLVVSNQVVPRYRVAHLPDMPNLAPADVALAGAAVGAWRHSDSSHPSAIVFKLLALTPEDVDPGPEISLAHTEGSEEVFQQMLVALRTNKLVSFDYQKLGGAVEQRLVKPLRVVLSGAGTYLQGFDVDRGATRLFRFSRIEGSVELLGCQDVSEDFDAALEKDAFSLGASPIDLVRPTLWVRASSKAAEAMSQWSDPQEGPAPQGWVRRLGVAGWQGTWIRRILAAGTDMIAVEPPSFARFVRAQVKQVADA